MLITNITIVNSSFKKFLKLLSKTFHILKHISAIANIAILGLTIIAIPVNIPAKTCNNFLSFKNSHKAITINNTDIC